MKKIRVCYRSNNKITPLFIIGYYSDGGFFIKDLIKSYGENYLVSKTSIPRNLKPAEFTNSKINKKNTWHTSFIKPKFSHHGNGFAQISETGLRSGVFKTVGFFKGVAIKSINLFLRNNDGGPLYAFNIWGLDNMEFNQDVKGDDIILDDADFFDFRPPYTNTPGCFIFEFFYLPNQAKGHINKDGRIWLRWDGYGDYIARYIPEEEYSPGFLAISCKKDVLGSGFNQWPFGLSMSGCPGFPRLLDFFRSYKQINVIYPVRSFGSEVPFNARELLFTKFWHTVSILDDRVSKIINALVAKIK